MDNNIKKTWEKIYQEWFNLEKDFSNIQIPENYNPKKHFAIIVAQGVTMNEVIVTMRKSFKVYLYVEDLDAKVIQNDRTARDGDYIVLFNRNIEADKEFKNMSANQLSKINHEGITLIERLLLEVLYYNKTKKHLDINSLTLCVGSRNSVGDVPCVDCGPGNDRLLVRWRSPDLADDLLRSRAVVS